MAFVRWPPAAATLVVVLVATACAGEPASAPTSAVDTPSSPLATAGPTVSQTASPSPTDPSPTADATDGAASGLRWTEGATVAADEGGLLLVTEVSAWDGGFIAIGQAYPEGFVGAAVEPVIWVSADGRSWDEVQPNFGPGPLELRGILGLSAGGVIVIGEVVGATEGPRARAFRSEDGRSWTELDLPTEIAEQGGVRVTSGPVGHVVVAASREVWYSAEAESWQLVREAPDGVELLQPAAGDEGFAVPATVAGGGDPIVYASGDGLSWFVGSPPSPVFSVAPWRGDWLGWSHTQDPATISLLQSTNGLEWSVTHDVNDLTGPDGPKAGNGMESDITEVAMSGAGGVVVATLGWNHCCAQPPVGVQVLISTDGESFARAELADSAYVTSIATDGEVVVAVGHLDRGTSAGFWVADR